MYELASPNLPRKDILYIFFIALFGTLFGVLILVRIDQWQRDSLYIATEAALPEHAVSEYVNKPISESVMSGWIVYSNKKYGFEFRYPKEIANIRSNEDLVIMRSYSNNFFEPVYGFAVKQKEAKLSLDEWMQKTALASSEGKKLEEKFLTQEIAEKINQTSEIGVDFRQENIKVAGQPAVLQILEGEGGGQAYILFSKDNKVFIYYVAQDGRLTDDAKKLLLQIAGTFKFIY